MWNWHWKPTENSIRWKIIKKWHNIFKELNPESDKMSLLVEAATNKHVVSDGNMYEANSNAYFWFTYFLKKGEIMKYESCRKHFEFIANYVPSK